MIARMRTNVSIRHFRCFIALAESGSFTVAASRLFMTQSSLTATIQQFEEDIGFKLFDRTTRRVVMTPEAVEFRARAEKVLKEFDNSIRDLKAFGQGEHGHIRIAAAASVIDRLLVRVIPQFQEAYPKVTISLRDANAEKVEKMVLDGEVDVAIDSRHKNFDGLVYTPLLRDVYGVVCHPDYWLAQLPAPLRWSDLQPENYIAFTPDTGIRKFLTNCPSAAPLFATPHDEVSSTRWMYPLISPGHRYSILPALALRDGDEARLVFRELHEPLLSREMCLIWPRLRSLSPTAQRIIDILLAFLQQEEMPYGVSVVSDLSPKGPAARE
jgi:DNA-binding transcriptional LysR family regulator